jgi:hypothetical protein
MEGRLGINVLIGKDGISSVADSNSKREICTLN